MSTQGRGRQPGRGESGEEEGLEGRTLPPTSGGRRRSRRPGFGEEEWRLWERRGLRTRLGVRLGTWRAARLAGRPPGREGVSARPLRARPASRASREAPPRGAQGSRSLSPAAGGALCGGGGGSESHLLAAERQGRGRSRRGREAAARAHSPAAPTSRGSAVCGSRPARAPRPRPGPASGPDRGAGCCSPSSPARSPPPGAAGEFETSAGRRRRLDVPGSHLGAPAPLSSPERAAARGRASPGEGASEPERAARSEPARGAAPCQAGRRISPSACRRRSRREVSEATGRGRQGAGVRARGHPRATPGASPSPPRCSPCRARADGGGAPRPPGPRANPGGVCELQFPSVGKVGAAGARGRVLQQGTFRLGKDFSGEDAGELELLAAPCARGAQSDCVVDAGGTVWGCPAVL